MNKRNEYMINKTQFNSTQFLLSGKKFWEQLLTGP